MGVTEIVPEIKEPVALVLVNEGTLPAPLAAKPMAVLLLVHAKVEPVGELAKVVNGTTAPAQIVSFGIAVTVGNGLTVIL